MAYPKIHHYIPKSYLRNFSLERNGQQYVYVRFKGEKFHSTNIKNICSQKDFYSLPDNSQDKKYLIENFYAENIDSLFPKITDLITEEKIDHIDNNSRREILTAVISLYFRTPKFLNYLSNTLISYSRNINSKSKCEVPLFGKILHVELEPDIPLSEIRMVSKEIFLKEHIDAIDRFSNFKLNDGIAVKKIVDDSEYITSDNPVIIRRGNNLFDLFDPFNSVSIPITPKHLLIIFPYNELSIKNTFHRINGEILDVITTNVDVESNSEDWIIGSEKSVATHLLDQVKYNEPSPTNYKIVSDLEEKRNLFNNFNILLERENGMMTPKVLLEIKKLSSHPLLAEDTNWQYDLKLLRDKGYNI